MCISVPSLNKSSAFANTSLYSYSLRIRRVLYPSLGWLTIFSNFCMLMLLPHPPSRWFRYYSMLKWMSLILLSTWQPLSLMLLLSELSVPFNIVILLSLLAYMTVLDLCWLLAHVRANFYLSYSLLKSASHCKLLKFLMTCRKGLFGLSTISHWTWCSQSAMKSSLRLISLFRSYHIHLANLLLLIVWFLWLSFW